MIRGLIIVLTLSATISLPLAKAAEAPAAQDPLAKNAALAYWQAFILMPTPDDNKDFDATAPIDAEVIKLVESGDVAVGQMQRAVKMERCIWGADLDAGIAAQLPHLSQARKMARFVCLRARVRIRQDRGAEAIDEFTSVMGMARHAGSDGLLISLLVQYAIEGMAIELLAEHLPTLEDDLLDRLSERIEGLPEGKSMSYSMRMEKILLLEWFIDKFSKPGGKELILDTWQNQVAEVDEEDLARYKAMSPQEIVDGLIELREVYDKLGEMMQQPPSEVDGAAEDLLKKGRFSDVANEFGSAILPAVGKMRRTEASFQTKQVMFKAAIAVVKKGQSELEREEFRDPYGEGPFKYSKTTGGFTLQSKLLDRNGKPVVLNVGPAVGE